VGFVLFLLVFLSLYSGLHLYAILKVRAALTLGTGMTVGVLVFMIIMILAGLSSIPESAHGFQHTLPGDIRSLAG